MLLTFKEKLREVGVPAAIGWNGNGGYLYSKSSNDSRSFESKIDFMLKVANQENRWGKYRSSIDGKNTLVLHSSLDYEPQTLIEVIERHDATLLFIENKLIAITQGMFYIDREDKIGPLFSTDRSKIPYHSYYSCPKHFPSKIKILEEHESYKLISCNPDLYRSWKLERRQYGYIPVYRVRKYRFPNELIDHYYE